MTVATYEGIVKDGQIRLLGGVSLAEHTAVSVIVPSVPATDEVFEVMLPAQPIRIMTPRLADPTQASRFEMEVKELDDAAV